MSETAPLLAMYQQMAIIRRTEKAAYDLFLAGMVKGTTHLASGHEAVAVGRLIGTSPLVKTAIAGRDPNWGRILSAAGRAGVPFEAARARVWIGAVEVYRHGVPHPEREAAASGYLRAEDQITIGIDLALGSAAAEVWTCDLTADYVQINADYRS